VRFRRREGKIAAEAPHQRATHLLPGRILGVAAYANNQDGMGITCILEREFS